MRSGNLDSLAEAHYARWDPQFFDEERENPDEVRQEIDLFEIEEPAFMKEYQDAAYFLLERAEASGLEEKYCEPLYAKFAAFGVEL